MVLTAIGWHLILRLCSGQAIGFLKRWAEYSADDLADSLRHAEKDEDVKVVLDEALPVLVQLRELLQWAKW